MELEWFGKFECPLQVFIDRDGAIYWSTQATTRYYQLFTPGIHDCVYLPPKKVLDHCNIRFCRVCSLSVRVWVSYRSFRSSGLGYKTLTELTDVRGYCGPGVQNSQKFLSDRKTLYRYPGDCEIGRTELTQVPDTGEKVVQN